MTLRRDRNRRNKKEPVTKIKTVRTTCPNCGNPGPHFVPPSFGDIGFFICKKANS